MSTPRSPRGVATEQQVVLRLPDVALEGEVVLPQGATGIVVFVHGSGSSRFSPRNQRVARHFNALGLGTLLFDLLTADEHRIDEATRELRFDIPMLARRTVAVVDWLRRDAALRNLKIGLFGASTGAAAALVAAAERAEAVAAVVSRGGRSDLAGMAATRVKAPTLLIVGAYDDAVLALNRETVRLLKCAHRLEVVPGATHLFEEPGTLEVVATLAGNWFVENLG